ncbi:MAG: hypothetical protein HOC71_10395 [Candidatus Latescibacteria bacterium]|jgi:hypothetical protein|nr:hypothetical protein [Candidatus Latescibacterota bacterium]
MKFNHLNLLKDILLLNIFIIITVLPLNFAHAVAGPLFKSGTDISSSNTDFVGDKKIGGENILHWGNTSVTWTYNLTDCALDDTMAVNCLEASFDKWESVSDATITFTNGGSSGYKKVLLMEM